MAPLTERSRTTALAVLWLACLAGLAGFAYRYFVSPELPRDIPLGVKEDEEDARPITPSSFPDPLLKVYDVTKDFRNEKGITPSYWNEVKSANDSGKPLTWGPCYPPHENVDWENQINHWYGANHSSYHDMRGISRFDKNLSGYCRPGFLIIGAGKSGTSSLYHYLVGHPRVLPAIEKQIHFFKYFKFMGIKWYLAHFPTATSFLSAGALMTGEASPGYMPYPGVAYDTAQMMPGAKIVAIGRDPIDRAWSSYNFEYVRPLIESMKQGKIKGVPTDETDEYYRDRAFPFEELLRVELKTLKECFAPDGPGPKQAKQAFGQKPWAKAEFDRREREGLPSLIDLDEHCYGGMISNKVPRKQFTELVEKYPDKVFNLASVFLTQSLLGRSLYVFPLEWWYITFPREDIYFICTEEMRDLTGEPLNELGQFLGLPRHDFTSVLAEGMFNVAGHEGYDTATSWEEVDEEQEKNDTVTSPASEMPLSEEFRDELLEFFKPYNERLFQLVGRRCNW